MTANSVCLLGVRIDRVDMTGALEAIEGFVESRSAHMVVTADASAIVIAQKDQEFRRVLDKADLVTPDSAGILLASKWYGNPLPERVSGVDLAIELSSMAARRGWPIFLLGAEPGVAELAAQALKGRCKGLTVAGTHHGYFEDDEEVVRRVAASGARMLFVAMGIPKQEMWIARHLDRLRVGVAIGVGGTFDVLSGRVSRAPDWMRQHGLEWAHRLACNPRKIGKVMTLPRFLGLVLADRFLNR
jgi:N-acetylglucosaminyldiphosphoundecaprenol N-acetyl-beta-D-mannosaminyltransferase